MTSRAIPSQDAKLRTTTPFTVYGDVLNGSSTRFELNVNQQKIDGSIHYTHSNNTASLNANNIKITKIENQAVSIQLFYYGHIVLCAYVTGKGFASPKIYTSANVYVIEDNYSLPISSTPMSTNDSLIEKINQCAKESLQITPSEKTLTIQITRKTVTLTPPVEHHEPKRCVLL